jgi:hypothetical protein
MNKCQNVVDHEDLQENHVRDLQGDQELVNHLRDLVAPVCL